MRTNRIVPYLALIAFVIFLTAQIGESQSGRSTKRALLVGINRYQNPKVPPTLGAEEDAEETKRVLIENYGFHEADVVLLNGSKATAQRIKDEFRRWLIEGTKPGDQVFFLYAGHGTQVDDENGDEAKRTPGDLMDEALAPFDVMTTEKNVITDDELGLLINQLSGRMAVLVFDSCHSGTVSRSIGANITSENSQATARYLPSLKELEKLQSRSSRGGIGEDYIVKPPPQGSRDLNLVVDKESVKAGGVVILSAAQPDQLAYSVKISETSHRGAFTYLLNQHLRDSKMTLISLQSSIEREMPDFLRSMKINQEQTPYFETFPASLESQPLFGEALTVPAVALSNPVSTIKLSISTLEGKRTYHFGTDGGKPFNEFVSYEVQTSEPGYLYLIVFSVGDPKDPNDDVATRIFPNSEQKDNRIERGTKRIFRDPTTKEGFFVTEPEGRDIVVALISSSKLNLGQDNGYEKESYSWSEIFDLLNSRRFSEQVEKMTRGQSAKAQTAPVPLEMTNWQSASIVVEAKKVNR